MLMAKLLEESMVMIQLFPGYLLLVRQHVFLFMAQIDLVVILCLIW